MAPFGGDNAILRIIMGLLVDLLAVSIVITVYVTAKTYVDNKKRKADEICRDHYGLPQLPALPAHQDNGTPASTEPIRCDNPEVVMPNGEQITIKKKEEAEPIIMTGTGHNASEKFTLEKGLYLFKITNTENTQNRYGSNFTVWLLNDEGDDIKMLANKLGSTSLTEAYGVEKTGVYLFNVNSEGEWTIEIKKH